MYGLPVTRTFEACAVGWYTPRKRSPRDRFVRERVLPTSFDHLEYRREYLTFHSTRIRREYPRLPRPDQTTNLIVSRVRYVALTYYSRQQRYYAIISSFTHLHFFFLRRNRDTEIAYSYNVLAYFVICVFLLPAFPSSFD